MKPLPRLKNKKVQNLSSGRQVLGMWFNGALSAGHMARCKSFKNFSSQEISSSYSLSTNIVQTFFLDTYCSTISSHQLSSSHSLSTNISQPHVLNKYCPPSHVDLAPNFSGTLFGISNTVSGGGMGTIAPLVWFITFSTISHSKYSNGRLFAHKWQFLNLLYSGLTYTREDAAEGREFPSFLECLFTILFTKDTLTLLNNYHQTSCKVKNEFDFAMQFVQVITNILGKEQTLESWQAVFCTAGAIYCTGAAIYFALIQVGVVFIWCGMAYYCVV